MIVISLLIGTTFEDSQYKLSKLLMLLVMGVSNWKEIYYCHVTGRTEITYFYYCRGFLIERNLLGALELLPRDIRILFICVMLRSVGHYLAIRMISIEGHFNRKGEIGRRIKSFLSLVQKYIFQHYFCELYCALIIDLNCLSSRT